MSVRQYKTMIIEFETMVTKWQTIGDHRTDTNQTPAHRYAYSRSLYHLPAALN